MPESRKIWEIQLAVHATAEEAEHLKERISRLLCPDPDHTPPCPIPWAISLVSEAREHHTALLEQAEIEGTPRS